MLKICTSLNAILRDDEVFDPWRLTWRRDDPRPQEASARPATPVEAMSWLYERGMARRVPVAVIGPKRSSPRLDSIAETLGSQLGRLGAPLITGGKSGVMEAACRGNAAAGGIPIGILPDEEWAAANDHVSIPIATGIGPARNAIIARAAFALVAVGGEHGTITEMAYGIHFGRLVVALEGAPAVPGVITCSSVEDALALVAGRFFSLDATISVAQPVTK